MKLYMAMCHNNALQIAGQKRTAAFSPFMKQGMAFFGRLSFTGVCGKQVISCDVNGATI